MAGLRWAGISWARPSPDEGKALSPLDGQRLGAGHLRLFLGPRSRFGARYFALVVEEGHGSPPKEPVVMGLHHAGPLPSYNWLEIASLSDDLSPAGRRRLFRLLGSLVPPGGHLMVEYDSPGAAETARCLSLGVPPLATPLGELLLEAGCGPHIRDWHIAEGGREGPRKLQGFRPLDKTAARSRLQEAARELEKFLALPASGDTALKRARSRARRILSRLARGPTDD